MNRFRFFLWFTVWLCWSAHAADTRAVKAPQGQLYVDMPSVVSAQQRLVFYRSPTARQVGVIALYINNRYHTSLQHNTFSAVCLDLRSFHLRAKVRLDMGQKQLQLESEYDLTPKSSANQYVRVSEHSDGRPRLDLVSPKVALNELITARQQLHVHSRIASARECQESTPGHKTDQPDMVLSLASDIWFAPRRTELKGITAQSRQELDAIIQRIEAYSKNSKQIRVLLTGRADDTDDPYQNEESAKARAQTISLYLLSNGLTPQSVIVEWSAAHSQTHPHDGYHNRRAELGVFINPN